MEPDLSFPTLTLADAHPLHLDQFAQFAEIVGDVISVTAPGAKGDAILVTRVTEFSPRDLPQFWER